MVNMGEKEKKSILWQFNKQIIVKPNVHLDESLEEKYGRKREKL